MAPAPTPSAAGHILLAGVLAGLSDITRTPVVATTMAMTIGTVSVSPRNRSPNTATWTGSVLMYAMVTTNERAPMAASISAVARTWVSAPSITHGQKVRP